MVHRQLSLPQQRLLLLLLVFPMLLSAHYHQKHPRRYDSNEYDEDESVQTVEEDPPFNNLQEEDAYLTVVSAERVILASVRSVSVTIHRCAKCGVVLWD